MSSLIKNVLVIGASGNIGQPIVTALLSANFTVSVLTRETSNSTFPPNVAVHKTDYSTPSLLQAFKGQDAIVSAIATLSTVRICFPYCANSTGNSIVTHRQSIQTSIVEAAAQAGVKRFIPSEYGIDTSIPAVEDVVPLTKPKRDTIAQLRAFESKGLSWTAIIVGSFFDWTYEIPGLMGWDVPARKALIFDNGTYEYEATNTEQIARAVVAVLKPEHIEETKNQYVYINSFTVTQNQVLATLEKITGDKFSVEHLQVAEVSRRSLLKIKYPDSHGLEDDPKYDSIGFGVILAAIYGQGGFNNYSKTRGLWNERLGLPREDVEESLRRALGNVEIAANTEHTRPNY
jgi:nucleoside-diphosphate-sugar epimerase